MLKKILRITIYLVVLTAFTSAGAPFVRQFLVSRGIIQEEVKISGTGSMYPTFPKGLGDSDLVRAAEIVAWPKMHRYPSGFTIFNRPIFNSIIKKKDIVEINNEKTRQISVEKYGEEAGFVKRVVAVAGDMIEFRDGYVYVNGSIADEPYTAKPRSTYGGDFLPDCKTLTIPEDYVFVLGDNRKASLDSRFDLGLVKTSEIHYLLPWEDQIEYQSLWRDSSLDQSYAHSTTLNASEFVNLVNEKRNQKQLKPYTYSAPLASSAKRRGYIMIETDDFSTEATKSGVTLAKAIKEAGYRNIIFAELFTRGNFEARELFDNFMEFPDTQKLLFTNTYQDMGVAAVLADLNGCPTEVVVVHLGGYIPPQYSQAEIDSWKTL